MNAVRSLLLSIGSVVVPALIIGCTHTIAPPSERFESFSPGLTLVMTPDRVLDGYLLGVGLFHQQPDQEVISIGGALLTFNGERHPLDKQIPFRTQPRWCYSGDGDIEIVYTMGDEKYTYTVAYPSPVNADIPAEASISSGARITIDPAIRPQEAVIVEVTGARNGRREVVGEFTFDEVGSSTVALTGPQISTIASNAYNLVCSVYRHRTLDLSGSFPSGGTLKVHYKTFDRPWTVR